MEHVAETAAKAAAFTYPTKKPSHPQPVTLFLRMLLRTCHLDLHRVEGVADLALAGVHHRRTCLG